MHHRIGSSFVIVALLAPFAAHAQIAQPAVRRDGALPQFAPAYAQPAPSPSYGQPPYAQTYAHPAYHRSAVGTSAHTSAGTLVPASYPYASYGNAAAPNYGPGYMQGNASPWAAQPAEAPAPPVKTKDNLHYIEMGTGAFIPTDSGNSAKLGLEANVWAIHGGWVPNSGLFLTLDASTGFDIGCMAARAGDGCKGHLRIHWIGTGPFFNTGTPMIARDVPRSWDLMALTGAEVRVWRGMTAKATLNWFVPSPWGVYEHQKGLAEARASGAVASGAQGTGTEQLDIANPMDAVSDILGHALKHPQVNLMAMWEF